MTSISVIPVILQQNDYEQVYSDIGWYKLKTGSSAQSICWDNTKLNGLGDISIKKCDIINLFWQSGITDIQDSANVFYVTLVDNDELKKNYPNLKSLGNYPELDVNKYIYDDQVDTTEKSAVVDWYYKQHVSGVSQYAGGIKSLVDGIGQIVPGIDTAVNGIQTAVEKMTALSSKIDADQIANFSDSMTAYTTGVSDYTSAVGQYIWRNLLPL